MEPLRTCRVCGVKAFNQNDLKKFTPQKTAKYDRENTCISCRTKYKMDRKNKIRKEALELYGKECLCCRERNKEFLVLHHVKGGGNQERKKLGKTPTYSKMIELFRENPNEATKLYCVLCYNCNNSIEYYGYCPHNKNSNH